jgi:hypothetical protein
MPPALQPENANEAEKSNTAPAAPAGAEKHKPKVEEAFLDEETTLGAKKTDEALQKGQLDNGNKAEKSSAAPAALAGAEENERTVPEKLPLDEKATLGPETPNEAASQKDDATQTLLDPVAIRVYMSAGAGPGPALPPNLTPGIDLRLSEDRTAPVIGGELRFRAKLVGDDLIVEPGFFVPDGTERVTVLAAQQATPGDNNVAAAGTAEGPRLRVHRDLRIEEVKPAMTVMQRFPHKSDWHRAKVEVFGNGSGDRLVVDRFWMPHESWDSRFASATSKENPRWLVASRLRLDHFKDMSLVDWESFARAIVDPSTPYGLRALTRVYFKSTNCFHKDREMSPAANLSILLYAQTPSAEKKTVCLGERVMADASSSTSVCAESPNKALRQPAAVAARKSPLFASKQTETKERTDKAVQQGGKTAKVVAQADGPLETDRYSPHPFASLLATRPSFLGRDIARLGHGPILRREMLCDFLYQVGARSAAGLVQSYSADANAAAHVCYFKLLHKYGKPKYANKTTGFPGLIDNLSKMSIRILARHIDKLTDENVAEACGLAVGYAAGGHFLYSNSQREHGEKRNELISFSANAVFNLGVGLASAFGAGIGHATAIAVTGAAGLLSSGSDPLIRKGVDILFPVHDWNSSFGLFMTEMKAGMRTKKKMLPSAKKNGIEVFLGAIDRAAEYMTYFKNTQGILGDFSVTP